MSVSGFLRRDFLRAAGTTALVPLIGTARAWSPGRPTRVAALKGSARSVVIPTHEFYGSLDERLDFPAEWEINVMNMRGHAAPALTTGQIQESLSKPIGTPPLREIAAGKKTVVITFDDLTRATPTYKVVPWVLFELRAAGIGNAGLKRPHPAGQNAPRCPRATSGRFRFITYWEKGL